MESLARSFSSQGVSLVARSLLSQGVSCRKECLFERSLSQGVSHREDSLVARILSSRGCSGREESLLLQGVSLVRCGVSRLVERSLSLSLQGVSHRELSLSQQGGVSCKESLVARSLFSR